jgi:predicted negative regulator of RcsB-dependent stress response
MVAKLAYESGKADEAKATLGWLVENSADKGYASVARLRLAAILIDAKAYDDALKLLGAGIDDEFLALADDRKGDIFVLQGKRDEARTAYQKAYKAFEEQSEYRRLVGVKLTALGVNPQAQAKSVAATEGAK